MLRVLALCGLAFAALSTACSDKPHAAAAPISDAALPRTNHQVFEVKGVVIGLQPEEKTVKIRHEEIPGYMPAMTMPFEVKDAKELNGLEAGDTVSFRMIVTGTDGWIEQLKKLDQPRNTNLPTSGPFRLVREVEPLNVGDPLPEYHFTDQLGQPIRLSQFRGQALAITFIFTRCPYPTFCPRVSSNFEEAQTKLLAMSNVLTNWHLLTISFDPNWDTPARLKAYAVGLHYNSNYWSFATGELIEITALAEQCGVFFWHEGGGEGISHNLRTAVVDARGKVQTILRENKWTSGELVAEILKAAQP